MKAPIFIRPLTDAERTDIEAGLRSPDAFVLRRCQILLASARQERAPAIATALGCGEQTVRDVIHDFTREGLAACLTRHSSRPKHLRTKLDPSTDERLRAILHTSPREFGKPTSVWTLDLVADVVFAEGLTTERVSDETIRTAIRRLGVRWKRAKQWITSPDPAYAVKKRRRDRLLRWAGAHPEWVLGFEDEVWFSRVSQPSLHSWADPDQPLRLVEQTVAKQDPDPKALACYGLLLPDTQRVWLRWVDGRPVSGITTAFLDWCCARLAAEGKTALLLVWDNASWHGSAAVRTGIRAHNRAVKRGEAVVRILACFLPVKSPWLNPIEPHWVHAKRAVSEPARLLTARELEDRVCAYFSCPLDTHLAIPQVVA